MNLGHSDMATLEDHIYHPGKQIYIKGDTPSVLKLEGDSAVAEI